MNLNHLTNENGETLDLQVCGTRFITFDLRTEAKTTKNMPVLVDGKIKRQPNPHHGHVEKISTGLRGMIFSNMAGSAYVAMVQREMEKEGLNVAEFTPTERTWAERIEGTPFIRHKKTGQMYLEFISGYAPNSTTVYELYGKETGKHNIIGLDDNAEKKKPQQGGLSDKNKIIFRTPMLQSITRIVHDGSEYTLRDNVVNTIKI